jgi:hypothetical protein
MKADQVKVYQLFFLLLSTEVFVHNACICSLETISFFFVNKERYGRREDHDWYAARSSDEQGEPSTWTETDIQSINSLDK